MINLKNLEIWFITGSQHLYGEENIETGSRTCTNHSNGDEPGKNKYP